VRPPLVVAVHFFAKRLVAAVRFGVMIGTALIGTALLAAEIGPGVVAGISLSGLASQDQVPFRRLFRSGVDLVSVNVTVLDSAGQLVQGLDQNAFEVFEDGERQTITQFLGDRVPVSLGVLLDTSDSMFGARIEGARAAVDRFLFDLLDAQDEFFVLAFNHTPRLLTDWTTDSNVVRPALDRLRPSGATAAYDAVLAGLPLFEARHRPRAGLVVISDGADTASDATVRDVRDALLRSDAFVYAIAIDTPVRQAINTRVNPQALREITDQSGGRTAVVASMGELADATEQIANELSHQYVLGYVSARATDDRFHSIRVRVKHGDRTNENAGEYKVRARSGYIGSAMRGRSR
jgi:Ca-activated chloride channel homolog